MLWPVVALGLALLVPLVTRGSYTRLLEKPWRWGSFLVAALVIQLALEILPIPESRWHDLGFGLLVASYVLLLAFCARNALIRGMSVVFIGVFANALAITVNQGMPVDVPADWRADGRIEATIKHHPQDDGDHLIVLTDIIVLRAPFDTVLSFGDLILAVGLCDVTYHASRRPRRRRATARADAQQRARTFGRVAGAPPPDEAWIPVEGRPNVGSPDIDQPAPAPQPAPVLDATTADAEALDAPQRDADLLDDHLDDHLDDDVDERPEDAVLVTHAVDASRPVRAAARSVPQFDELEAAGHVVVVDDGRERFDDDCVVRVFRT
jgi:hypothetical protein